MIQRIQSVYLSLTILLSLLFLKGGFLTFVDRSGSVMILTIRGLFRITGSTGNELIGKMLPLSAIMILIPVLALVTILLFKDRKIQVCCAYVEIILATGLVLASLFYSYLIIVRYNTSIVPGIKMAIPVAILILSILAYRGIRKDDRLVKSYDRLR